MEFPNRSKNMRRFLFVQSVEYGVFPFEEQYRSDIQVNFKVHMQHHYDLNKFIDQEVLNIPFNKCIHEDILKLMGEGVIMELLLLNMNDIVVYDNEQVCYDILSYVENKMGSLYNKYKLLLKGNDDI